MMKISKPITTNDFILSPVQFTSLNAIVFKNVKNVYDVTEKILLEYEHSHKIEPSARDWIGIFPRGWSTLQQYVTFEWVPLSIPWLNNEQNKENGELIRKTIHFCPKYHMGSVNNNSFYQFVYVSKQIEVLGVSSYFRFDLSSVNDKPLELECLVPVSPKLRSTSVSDFELLLTNNLSSSTSIDNRTVQTNSIHSLQNMDAEGKNWTKPQNQLNIADVKKSSVFPRRSAGTGDALDPYSSHSEPVFPMSFQMNHCKKCFQFKRGSEFLRSQQVLQSKVGLEREGSSVYSGQRRSLGRAYLSEDKLKIVMERNKVLEERAQEMKKEMEKIQAESKKLKMSFYNINKEKIAYEKFVKNFIKSLEKDSIVRVVNGNTEILVKKVNYVGMEEHPRDKKTSKRERELKAVIGLQEITIRNLINSLQEKAKSVQELNQTVKLAQAFSAAREDSKEYNSEVEEGDDGSNSDAASEYEFSLNKPPTSEETTVEDTDTVLDDIRRTTEMELKDIGISRSLGKSSSRDSELGLPNLSVHSFQSQNDSTRPKKPRLLQNQEDCWPYEENTRKTVQRKVLDPYSIMEGDNCESNFESISESKDESKELEPDIQSFVNLEKTEPKLEMDGDHLNYESYYDACEGLNSLRESNDLRDNKNNDQQESKDNKEKNNFLVTAIIPQDLEVKPSKALQDWNIEKKDTEKEEPETNKGKKFTCELSIDFAAKVFHGERIDKQLAIEDGHVEEPRQSCNTELMLPECQNNEKSLTFHKSNKSVEIKITQVDQKENPNKNYVHQKMILKFAKEPQPGVEGTKPSKFEFNVALTGLGENAKLIKTDLEESQGFSIAGNDTPELQITEEDKLDMDTSPRTVWNDATDDIVEDSVNEEPLEETPRPETPEAEESQSEAEELKEESSSPRRTKFYEDSLRYEKNLEFLQQKTEEKLKEESEIEKEKPSAILIQNGPTKLALIRYQ